MSVTSFILWIRMYFPKEKEVVLVDENYEDQMPLSPNGSNRGYQKVIREHRYINIGF